ncbi:hypothetical protein SAMN04515674_101138 [Pseudarcicella hirudinis]|uniref:Pycsar effector protein domain-containing protein n=2 Tax=Pseudarcicella hirudinis TaxID=1079859 RepID=A0A1I5M532_9BACT|nr:Pycsar system effector family protein [Pseudarcicella hirudinis]SFP04748.1 hypothetical protein SAMN04515674_101138 [Pseudarcicella hirudinis]
MKKSVLEAVQNHVEPILNALPVRYSFHNYAHTVDSVKLAGKIGAESDLEAEDFEKLMVAVWFIDLGYTNGNDTPEKRSAEMAEDFLKSIDYDAGKIKKVLKFIKVIKPPERPGNLPEMIMCDVFNAFYAQDNLFEQLEKLREETIFSTGHIGKRKWLKYILAQINAVEYFSPYGKANFEDKKALNIGRILLKLDELKQEKKEKKSEKNIGKKDIVLPDLIDNEVGKSRKGMQIAENKEVAILKKQPDLPVRGVETMFKSTSVNHFNLAALADHKAHIMISINAVIVSLVISILVRKLDDLPGLLIPIILLTIVSLLTIVFAILATRPKLAKGIFTQEQIDNKTANILYFGNFYKMELKDYESGINKMMNDSDFLYASMTKDLYDLGQILAHKYKMLRISYNIFMFGFVVSVIAFGISYFIDLN